MRVVDLTDFTERLRCVLGDDDDPVDVAQRSERPTPCDALARVVGAVLHHLFGGDVKRHGHDGTADPGGAVSTAASERPSMMRR